MQMKNLSYNGPVWIDGQGTTNYVVCMGNYPVPQTGSYAGRGEGAFYRLSKVRITDISDGTTNCFLAGERQWVGTASNGNPNFGDAYWAGTPDGWLTDVAGSTGVGFNQRTGGHPAQFSSAHGAGAMFVFGDGSVKMVRDSIDVATYKKLGAIASGQVINGDY
jgi:prepilin-type processing-associated H-X9-DG protein